MDVLAKASPLEVMEVNSPLEVWAASWKRLYREGEITKSDASSTAPLCSMVSGDRDLWISLWLCEDVGSPEGCQVCVGRGTRPGSHPLPVTRWRMQIENLSCEDSGYSAETRYQEIWREKNTWRNWSEANSSEMVTYPGEVEISGPRTRPTLTKRSCLRRGSRRNRWPCSLHGRDSHSKWAVLSQLHELHKLRNGQLGIWRLLMRPARCSSRQSHHLRIRERLHPHWPRSR